MNERIIEIANEVIDKRFGFKSDKKKKECFKYILYESDDADFRDENGNLVEEELRYQLEDRCADFMDVVGHG